MTKDSFIPTLRIAPKPLSLDCPEIPFKEDVSCCCQGCSGHYEDRHVMIVDDLGPVCMNCLYNLAYRYLR